VAGPAEDIAAGAVFDYSAGIHDIDTVSVAGNHAEVVSDEHESCIKLACQFTEKLK
jgi:hypothetical protein